MRGLLPPTPLGTPPGGARLARSRRSARPIAWRGRATSWETLTIKFKFTNKESNVLGRSC
eukprot:183724-Prorocentrum_minimum.AAC.1